MSRSNSTSVASKRSGGAHKSASRMTRPWAPFLVVLEGVDEYDVGARDAAARIELQGLGVGDLEDGPIRRRARDRERAGVDDAAGVVLERDDAGEPAAKTGRAREIRCTVAQHDVEGLVPPALGQEVGREHDDRPVAALAEHEIVRRGPGSRTGCRGDRRPRAVPPPANDQRPPS